MTRSKKPIERARSLRHDSVPAEIRLWRVLRNRISGGFKFRRQHPIGPYVVDFACLKCKLAVEVDGESHLATRAHDEQRTRFQDAAGWKVIRFWNTEVYEDLEPVQEAIYQECLRRCNR
jgi:very-short-patch-repair endonuclease